MHTKYVHGGDSMKRFRGVVRDFVFGMEDGLVSNLGLVLGVFFGGAPQFAIVLAGLSSMFAGAFSMSAGSYLSAKAQREVYEHEIVSTMKKLKKNPKTCMNQMKKMLEQEGLNHSVVKSLFTHTKSKHPDFVCNFVVQRKVGISKQKFDHPLKNALTMFLSFLGGSIFPILPFILASGNKAAITSFILTVIALFLVGWVKTIFTKRNWLKSGFEIAVVGIGAGIIGYVIGWLVSLVA